MDDVVRLWVELWTSANFDFAEEVKLHVWQYQVEDAV